MFILQKPGEVPSGEGLYTESGVRGGEVPNARVVFIFDEDFKRDVRLPPTSAAGRRWKRYFSTKARRSR